MNPRYLRETVFQCQEDSQVARWPLQSDSFVAYTKSLTSLQFFSRYPCLQIQTQTFPVILTEYSTKLEFQVEWLQNLMLSFTKWNDIFIGES